MGERLLEYNVMARRKHKLPVLSTVVYLKEDGEVPQPPLTWTFPGNEHEPVLQFGCLNVQLSQQDTDEMLALDLPGVLPLVSLTRDGKQPEMIERMIGDVLKHKELQPAHRKDLITLGYTLASLAITDRHDRNWLYRRFAALEDLIRQSPAYKRIKREGVEEGLEKGIKKGIGQGVEKGRRETLKKMLLKLVEEKFSELLEETRVFVADIDDATMLERLTFSMGRAGALEQARAALTVEQKAREQVH